MLRSLVDSCVVRICFWRHKTNTQHTTQYPIPPAQPSLSKTVFMMVYFSTEETKI